MSKKALSLLLLVAVGGQSVQAISGWDTTKKLFHLLRPEFPITGDKTVTIKEGPYALAEGVDIPKDNQGKAKEGVFSIGDDADKKFYKEVEGKVFCLVDDKENGAYVKPQGKTAPAEAIAPLDKDGKVKDGVFSVGEEADKKFYKAVGDKVFCLVDDKEDGEVFLASEVGHVKAETTITAEVRRIEKILGHGKTVEDLKEAGTLANWIDGKLARRWVAIPQTVLGCAGIVAGVAFVAKKLHGKFVEKNKRLVEDLGEDADEELETA